MAKPSRSAAEYRRHKLPKNTSLLKWDPRLYRLLEEGLQSADGGRWREAAEAVGDGSRGWAPLFLEIAAEDRRALCWMVAAAYHEHWTCGSQPTPWLRSLLRKVPGSAEALAELETTPDPWISQMAQWGSRVLSGKDETVGRSR